MPSFRESPGAVFVQFYGVALLSGAQPDKICYSQSQIEIQRQFSVGARKGVHWRICMRLFTVLFYRSDGVLMPARSGFGLYLP